MDKTKGQKGEITNLSINGQNKRAKGTKVTKQKGSKGESQNGFRSGLRSFLREEEEEEDLRWVGLVFFFFPDTCPGRVLEVSNRCLGRVRLFFLKNSWDTRAAVSQEYLMYSC